MRVAEGIEQFTDQDLVNWFLVETDEGPIAVDAGFPTAWEQIRDRAHELRAILVTHGHIDHLGFAPRAQREHGTPVYVPERDVALSRRPLTYARSERLPLLYLHKAATRRVYWTGIRAGAVFAKTVPEPTPYDEGTELPGGFRAIFTPGHTKGSTTLHLPDRDVVFVGDAIVTRDPYTDRTGPRIVARAATWNGGVARDSLDRIAATGAGTLVCGHGPVFEAGAEEAARLARETEVA